MGQLAFAQKTTSNSANTPTTNAKPADPKQYLALGKYYYYLGQYDSAYYAFRRVLDLDPQNKEALLGLGRTQTKLMLFSSSIDTLKKLIQLDNKNPSAYIALAQAYRDQYTTSEDRDSVKGNPDDALKILKDAENIHPSELSLAAIYNERALLYSAKNDDLKALEASKKAATLAPENGDVLSNLGRLFFKTGNTKDALETLKRATAANPRDSLTHALYGKLLILGGDYKLGLTALNRALRQDPKNAYILGQYGIALHLDPNEASRKSNASDSQKYLETAIKADPLRYPEFYYHLGQIALEQSDCKSGKSAFAKSVALDPQMVEYRLGYAKALESCGDRATAKLQYTEILKLDPNLKEAKDALSKLN